MHAASETCPFLAFSSFSVCRYWALLSSRFALLLCEASQRFRDNPVRCKSAASHHMAHGLDNPQGRTCNLPCQEKALESLQGVAFLTGCAPTNSPGGEPELFLYGRLSAVWSAARVCKHGWFDSEGGFYTPVAQEVEQRSPKPHVAGSNPAGSACVP